MWLISRTFLPLWKFHVTSSCCRAPFFFFNRQNKQNTYKPSVCYLPSSKEQSGSISIKLVDIVEHLEAKWVGSFPQELMRDIIILLSGGQRHDFKWVVALLDVCWMCNLLGNVTLTTSSLICRCPVLGRSVAAKWRACERVVLETPFPGGPSTGVILSTGVCLWRESVSRVA